MSNRLLPLTDSCQSDQGSSDGMEGIGSNCDTPTSSETIDTSGLNPTLTSPPNLKGSNKSSAAESGAGVIKLGMRPTECTAKPWIALLEIECKDVPRLMREGFFWSAENVLLAGGYMSWTIPACTALGYRHLRTWAVTDKPDDGAPQWSGKFEVASPLLETLINFRIEDLSAKNVWSADAWNDTGHSTYHCDYRDSIHNYNCIYDNEPLKGWWPWPKEQNIHTPFPSVKDQLFPDPPLSCPCYHCDGLKAPKGKTPGKRNSANPEKRNAANPEKRNPTNPGPITYSGCVIL